MNFVIKMNSVFVFAGHWVCRGEYGEDTVLMRQRGISVLSRSLEEMEIRCSSASGLTRCNSSSGNSFSTRLATTLCTAINAKESMANPSVPTAGDQPISMLVLVLLGRRNSGKSSAGNTILGASVFETGKKTSQCVKRHSWIEGVRLSLVDTPGWSSFGSNVSLVGQEILRSVRLCVPRAQAFLLVIPVDAFSNRDCKAVEEHMSLLGYVWNHTVVLFTWADELKGNSIEEHVEKRGGKHLRKILEKCGFRYCTLNNKMRDEHQVRQMMKIVKETCLKAWVGIRNNW